MKNKYNFNSELSQKIHLSYEGLICTISDIPKESFFEELHFTAGKVSPADIIAYQIGWGNLLIYWYEAGLRHEPIIMPGYGFDKWDYNAIAKHFYQKYSYVSKQEYIDEFSKLVTKIIYITEQEHLSGNLDKTGIFAWCSLKSRKDWPLSKWIKVNTVSPYNRAILLISRKKSC